MAGIRTRRRTKRQSRTDSESDRGAEEERGARADAVLLVELHEVREALARLGAVLEDALEGAADRGASVIRDDLVDRVRAGHDDALAAVELADLRADQGVVAGTVVRGLRREECDGRVRIPGVDDGVVAAGEVL